MVICNSGVKSKINSFLYRYKLSEVSFSHYFRQQFYFRTKDNQKECVQSTRVILTLLRLHHMKKAQVCGASHPQTPKYFRKPQVFRCFQGKQKENKMVQKVQKYASKYLYLLESFFKILLAILYLFWTSILYLIV